MIISAQKAAAKTLRLPVTVLCTLALVLVAFAGRTPEVDTRPTPAELAAYAFPDGSLPVICHGAGDTTGGHETTGQHCPLCTLTKILALPDGSDLPHYRRVSSDRSGPTADSPVVPHAIAEAHRARAPPALV